MSKKYYVKVAGYLYEVSKEIHDTYKREERRHRYLKDTQKEVVTLSYDALNDEVVSESVLVDRYVNVEEAAINNVMLEKLNKALSTLSDDELFLIEHLIFQELSERELSKRTGIPQKTINNRKHKVLKKLKKLLEN